MRILRLRLHNLNSLTGKWAIDFTHPAFTGDGIFAITGPTGAGKTTILDAICLALYGRTPRLDRVTKGGNEIMSRQTGECSAEVEFATVKGTFRCSWYQHRGRKLAAGALQAPKRELSEVESGKILASKANEVARQVEQCTGMDFDRFTRSMLLAQGGFAAFLQANQDERAPILEQITGSEIYTAISKQVHARFTEERSKQEKLIEKTGAMQLLSSAEATTIQEELNKQRQEEARLNKAVEEKALALAWLDRVKELQTNLEKIKKEQEGLAQEEHAFTEQAAQLKAAQQALILEGDYARLVTTRQQQQEEQVTLADLQQKLPQQEKSLGLAEEQLKQSKKTLAQSRANWDQGHVLIKQVRELDLRIQEKKQAIHKDEKSCHALQQANATAEQQSEKLNQELNQAQAQQEQSRTFLSEHQEDEQLISDLAGIRKTLGRFKEIADRQAALGPALEKAEHKTTQAGLIWQDKVQTCTVAEKELVNLQEQRLQIQQEADTRLDGRKTEELRQKQPRFVEQRTLLENLLKILHQKETVQQEITVLTSQQQQLLTSKKEQTEQLNLLRQQQDQARQEVITRRTLVEQANRIRDLEEERERLQKDHPCPLCGSQEHPYAQSGNIPPLNQFEQELQTALVAADQADKALSTAEVKAARLAQDEQNFLDRIKEKQGAVQEADQFIQSQCSEYLTLVPGPESDLRHEKPSTLITRLEKLAQRSQKNQQQLEALDQLDRKLARISKTLEQQQTTANQAAQEQERATHAREQREQQQQRLAQEQQESKQELGKIQGLALEELAGYAITDLRLEMLPKYLTDLTARKKAWEQHNQQAQNTEKQITALQSKLREIEAGKEARTEQLKAGKENLAENQKQQQALTEERFHLFKERNPDDEEKQLATALRQAENNLEKTQQEQARLFRAWELTKAGIKERNRAIDKRKEELNQLETGFSKQLQANEYADERAWQAARLPKEDRLGLSTKADALQTRRTQLDERLGDRQTRLAKEEELQLTKASPEELSTEHNELITTRKQATEQIGSLSQQLQTNTQQRAQQRNLLASLDTQKKECLRWKELHDLIGSADGKKYRNFAQGLTFELMVTRANQQLTRMTDRYLLVRDQAQPLELNVIDAWQAGEVRSTKNLSGGESFVVSLALALGLSEMVGGNVRVDSLFLDEGFGALDEEALETALETLAGLRREGKLIGVISHVGALKERIACQLEVVPTTGGQSIVQGAGVRLVE